MSKPVLKRKKKVNQNPNPLFTRWLTEWRDEAAEKGRKTQYAFGKALRALKKYPMPLSTGKSCSILDSFGDKICKMLDKKLEDYIAENGPIIRDPITGVLTKENVSGSTSIDISDSDSESVPGLPISPGVQHRSPVRKKRKTPKRSPGEYVPVYRSGPYALILTLYRNHIKDNSRGFMHKEELTEAAQQLADKSFSRPDPGSYYTAWSSMSTLINKGFVSKERQPARYTITEKGCELAHRLETVDKHQGVSSPKTPPSGSDTAGYHFWTSTVSSPVSPCLPRMEDSDVTSNKTEVSAGSRVGQDRPPKCTPASCQEFLFWYIDDRGRKVSMKDSAAVLIDDDIGVGFLVKCNRAALEESGRRYREERSKLCSDGDVYVYLANENAEDTCTMMSPNTEQLSSSIGKGPMPISRTTVPSHPSSSNATSQSASSSGVASRESSVPSSSQLSSSQQSSVVSCSQSSSPVREDSSQRSEVTDPPDPLFIFQPGEFEVVLCVDNCETAGGGARSQKQLLLPELMRNGVNMDVRKLQVGDFLWVAREKLAPRVGQLKMPERREVVLDFVVERKRMDDLCSSMQDGRFREQKFRLKNCGLRKPIYLVEEHGSSDHLSIPQSTLFQATVNTQISDGFFVKHTKDIKESVAYLTIMTRYLQSIYSPKTLIAYEKDGLDRIRQPFCLAEATHQLMTFKEFNEKSVKNKESSINETFAKQLLQISGMSAEKALAITTIYKTPACLFDAYNVCALPADKEKLLAKVKYGKLERNIGPVLSKQVHQLYCSPGPLM
ncbi:crossover junction endonuclease MUS81-like isoform X2 [Apostichopus japonicus]|uniref:crossover junction endonuclease MUS81-like isoform X2 n=1 Tax=Stichopus japonicus TaxID=307972 RepID=UPI003AB126B3